MDNITFALLIMGSLGVLYKVLQVIMDNITFTSLIKILLNVVLIAISIYIVSFVSDIIDNKFKFYKYWQIALRELLRFGIFLVVMAVVVSISYWLFILV